MSISPRRRVRVLLRITSYMVAGALPLAAQDVPVPDRVRDVLQVRAALEREGARLGPDIWPGFRPDTIPWLVGVGDEGTILVGWAGEAPEGMRRVAGATGAYWRDTHDRAAANTSIELGGRRVAQFAAGSLAPDALRGLAVHESFHAFEGASAREGLRFGHGENSFLVTRYPVFDAQNEADVALELLLLGDALGAPTDERAAALARAFLAVREGRQRRLETDLSEFEMMAELNEGLAEYALTRARFPDRASAVADIRARLAALPAQSERSFRLRFYATGAGMGLLLDRLAGPAWKTDLVRENWSIQDALAEASGANATLHQLVADARSRYAAERLDAEARERVAALTTRRVAQVDSVLDAAGVRLVIEAGQVRIGLCGIDPQNLLQVSPGRLLHRRWVRLCTGNRVDGEFTTAAIEDGNARTWSAVLGPAAEVVLTSGGVPVSPAAADRDFAELTLQAPGGHFVFHDVAVRFDGRAIAVRLR